MKKIISRILCFIFMFTIFLSSIDVEASVKDEMQAVWISSVYNLDWPSESARNNVQKQKQEFINILNDVKSIGLNTVIVQVRPKGDALYKSNINPWSDVLTGVQGKDPGYDPLKFIIDEAHKRGIKVHAWFNPYRVTTSGTNLSSLASNHFARKNPNTVFTYENALYYNPALPEVRQHIVDTVAEVVKNYNVDGVHFDDYFYPGTNVNDDAAYAKYGNGLSRGDFRRDSVNKMVQAVHNKVKSIKPNVEFGISPRGIWKNQSSDPTGSPTNGGQSYYDIYADTRTWIKSNWIDYVAPQVYWEIGNSAADYSKLVPWWSNEVKGTNVDLYIGHGIYRSEVASQIDRQIALNRQYSNVKGSIYYSYKYLKSNYNGSKDKISSSLMVPITSLIGKDRYKSAVEFSKSYFKNSNTVIIVNGLGLADGITATPLATNLKAPILLSEKDDLTEATKSEIRRLGAKKAIIVGGEGVVSKKAQNQLASYGVTSVERISGKDRYETALSVAKYIDNNCYSVKKIVVSNGLGEADAMSISSVAGREKMPIILTSTDSINNNVYSWLSSKKLESAYIIGGTGVVSNNILNKINAITSSNISGNRLGGKDRYATNALVIDKFFGNNLDKVYVSKGIELVDALSSGPIAALSNAPVVLGDSDLSAEQRRVLEKRKANKVIEAGGGTSKTMIKSLRKVLW